MKKILFTLAPLAFVLIGCEKWKTQTTKLQYMPDMVDTDTVKAQEDFLDPPEHSHALIQYLPKTIEESEKTLVRPAGLPKNPELAKQAFMDFCSHCHGNEAKGNGRLRDVYPIPPDITGAPYTDKKDGFFYHRIVNGSAIMPSLGHIVGPRERWMIIDHIRSLQKNKG